MYRAICLICSGLLFFGLTAGETQAGLVFGIFGEAGSPSGTWTLTGTHTAQGTGNLSTFGFGVVGDAFDVSDTNLSVAINAGGLKNNSTGFLIKVIDFDIFDSPEKFSFTTFNGSIPFTTGDAFSANAAGTWALSGGRTFDDLNVGTYALASTDPFGGTHTLAITAVPEPSSMALCGLVIGAVVAVRRRRASVRVTSPTPFISDSV